jgi:hypothetical protein
MEHKLSQFIKYENEDAYYVGKEMGIKEINTIMKKNGIEPDSGDAISLEELKVVIKTLNKGKKTKKRTPQQELLYSMIIDGVDFNTIKNKKQVKLAFIKMVENIFETGAGKRSKVLKNFTGPTLEMLGKLAIELCLIALKVNHTSYQINQSYIKDDKFDNIRLDEHLIIDGTYVLMQEARAWVDKPFANMKYQVAQDIFTLPYENFPKWSEMIIPILCYSYDITEKTFLTRDFVFNKTLLENNVNSKNSFGEYRIKFYNLSGSPRNSRGDYFSNGYSKLECENYINSIFNHIKNYINDKTI